MAEAPNLQYKASYIVKKKRQEYDQCCNRFSDPLMRKTFEKITSNKVVPFSVFPTKKSIKSVVKRKSDVYKSEKRRWMESAEPVKTVHDKFSQASRFWEDLPKTIHEKIQDEYKLKSSWMTILAVVNNMVGSSVISLPKIYSQGGVFNSIIFSFGIMLFSFHTCDLFVTHLKEEEDDLHETFQRILGSKWEKFFHFVSKFCLNLMMAFTNYLYFCNMLFNFFLFIFYKSGFHDYAPKNETKFDEFSFQYCAIITLGLFLLLLFLKTKYLVKITYIGFLPVLGYLVLVFYLFIENLNNDKVDTTQIKWFSTDIYKVPGSFSLAFFLHTGVVPLVKSNRNPENNSRDLFIGFFVSFLIYFYVGFFGMLGAIGKHPVKPTSLMDYITNHDNVLAAIVQILFMLKLGGNFAIFTKLARTHLVSLFYDEDGSVPRIFNLIYYSLVLGFVALIGIPGVIPTVLLTLNGALFGLLLIYALPVRLHLQCIIFSKLSIEKPEEFQQLLEDEPMMEACNDHSFWIRRKIREIGIGYLIFILAALFLSVLGFIDIVYIIRDYHILLDH